MKFLRTDRGGQFTPNEFKEFCSSHGIKEELTTTYTPQQNGEAERKNRTMVEMARCVLREMCFPNMYWENAIHSAIYILNKISTKMVKYSTPSEAWFYRNHNVSHFKIFGSTCFVYIPGQ